MSVVKKYEPIEALSNIKIAENIYSKKNCKFILLASKGSVEIFKYYFGEKYNHKLKIHQPLPAIAKNIDWNYKKNNLTKFNFLFLASDFHTKGVDLLLESWLNVKDRKKNINCSLF